jgi:hypothetical protein
VITATDVGTPGAERSGFDRSLWIGNIRYPNGHRSRLRGASFPTEAEAVEHAAQRHARHLARVHDPPH